LEQLIISMNNDNHWKKREGMVYSTDPDFKFNSGEDEAPDTLPPEKQNLLIQLSTKHRKGKAVTLISGFIGREEDLKSLERGLKTELPTGGSSKKNEIIIQGDFRNQAGKYLRSRGYKIKGV